jgi:hypothetical protein
MATAGRLSMIQVTTLQDASSSRQAGFNDVENKTSVPMLLRLGADAPLAAAWLNHHGMPLNEITLTAALSKIGYCSPIPQYTALQDFKSKHCVPDTVEDFDYILRLEASTEELTYVRLTARGYSVDFGGCVFDYLPSLKYAKTVYAVLIDGDCQEPKHIFSYAFGMYACDLPENLRKAHVHAQSLKFEDLS